METADKTRTVLVVEDEPMVNWDVADTLRDDGFEVLQAFSAEEGLRVLEKRRDVSVVFTDVNLPGALDGIAMAAVIQQRWPQIELLITSGHKQHHLDQLELVTLYGRFVPKPYPPEAISRRIHEIVDRAA